MVPNVRLSGIRALWVTIRSASADHRGCSVRAAATCFSAAACLDNRAFVGHAVTWAAGQGIGQFLDLAAGLPTSPAVHEAARAVNPRVCYVDNDPVVVRHADRAGRDRDSRGGSDRPGGSVELPTAGWDCQQVPSYLHCLGQVGVGDDAAMTVPVGADQATEPARAHGAQPP
jgi:S-adenosyl methyltransferase